MNIVVCGGGTAGWMAALMLAQKGSAHKITVLESSDVPIIGAGEGSTGLMVGFIQELEAAGLCTEQEFMREACATPKLGILHKDWRRLGHHYFGPIDSPSPVLERPEHCVAWAAYHDVPEHMVSSNGRLLEAGVTNFAGDGVHSDGMHGYHFDAHKVGAFFRKLALRKGVHHIDAKIKRVAVGHAGIEHVVLSSGDVLAGDFFIDATGFARVLSTALGVGWVSYTDYLPVNTALPFLVPHEREPVAATGAWAQKAGWIWQIPTAERMGCGYVFCDKFTTVDAAHAEIETALGHSVTPIRTLHFQTGRQPVFWTQNCLTIGLAAAFAEPLEATSIHSTLVQLRTFVNDFLRPSLEDTALDPNIKRYNMHIAQMYDDFRDFLSLHYITQRRDSDFWRFMADEVKRPERVTDVLDIVQHRLLTQADFTAYYGYAGASLWNWVLFGLGLIPKTVVAKEAELHGFLHPEFSAEQYLAHFAVQKARYAKTSTFISAELMQSCN